MMFQSKGHVNAGSPMQPGGSSNNHFVGQATRLQVRTPRDPGDGTVGVRQSECSILEFWEFCGRPSEVGHSTAPILTRAGGGGGGGGGWRGEIGRWQIGKVTRLGMELLCMFESLAGIRATEEKNFALCKTL